LKHSGEFTRKNEKFVITASAAVAYPGILFGGKRVSNSVEDKGYREGGSGGGSLLGQGFWRQL
jgi:hypothetical protein